MLKIEDLHVYYGGVYALKGLTLDIPDNTIVSLLGANGAGKSTTLRSICGLVKPRTGRILLGEDEVDLTKMEPAEIQKLGIAVIPEGRRVFTGLTVMENLKMGAWNRKDPDGIAEDIDEIYRLFPVLKARTNQKALTLSGGEQQMLSVSRALMSRPKLLLMDEPSLGLAPLLVAQLFKTIREIHIARNMTILLVEQNMRAAIKIADYGFVLETGTLVYEGTAAELANNPKVQEAYLG